MKKTFKRTVIAILAAAIVVVGFGGVSVNAARWEASHVNVPGVPISESTIDYITVYHRAAGATAICNYNTHSNASAVIGYTYIDCTNYAMSQVEIKNTEDQPCKPFVGVPTTDIAVNYKITANTTTSNDIFWSKGNIIKVS